MPEGRVRTHVSPWGCAHRVAMGIIAAHTPSFWTGGLTPPLPGQEADALRVGGDGAEELPGALQLQVGEFLPVPRAGQQALQCLQRCPAGSRGAQGPVLPPGRVPSCPGDSCPC